MPSLLIFSLDPHASVNPRVSIHEGNPFRIMEFKLIEKNGRIPENKKLHRRDTDYYESTALTNWAKGPKRGEIYDFPSVMQ